jgi:hypothetical protein
MVFGSHLLALYLAPTHDERRLEVRMTTLHPNSPHPSVQTRKIAMSSFYLSLLYVLAVIAQ